MELSWFDYFSTAVELLLGVTLVAATIAFYCWTRFVRAPKPTVVSTSLQRVQNKPGTYLVSLETTNDGETPVFIREGAVLLFSEPKRARICFGGDVTVSSAPMGEGIPQGRISGDDSAYVRFEISEDADLMQTWLASRPERIPLVLGYISGGRRRARKLCFRLSKWNRDKEKGILVPVPLSFPGMLLDEWRRYRLARLVKRVRAVRD